MKEQQDIAMQIDMAKKRFSANSYSMAIGEIANMYQDNEIILNAEPEHAPKWDIVQQSCFIESILLGIPIPSIFAQDKKGIWQVIDGVERLSTILRFLGKLKEDSSMLVGTKYLPSLEKMTWKNLPQKVKLDFKHTSIDIKVIKCCDANDELELSRRFKGLKPSRYSMPFAEINSKTTPELEEMAAELRLIESINTCTGLACGLLTSFPFTKEVKQRISRAHEDIKNGALVYVYNMPLVDRPLFFTKAFERSLMFFSNAEHKDPYREVLLFAIDDYYRPNL